MGSMGDVSKRDILFLMAAFAAVVSFATQVCAQDVTYPDWMVRHKEQLKDKAINEVVMLGSHDAASSDVDKGRPFSKGYLIYTDQDARRVPCAKDIAVAKCQSASIKDQLLYGVRFLDLRVAHQDGQYWSLHMLLSTPLFGPDGVFTQIKDFLKEYPDEVVIISVYELYSDKGLLRLSQIKSFYKILKKEFGELLVSQGDFGVITLGDIWKGRGRIIIIGDLRDDPTREKIIWDGRRVRGKWLGEKDPDALCKKLTQVLAKWKEEGKTDKVHVLQALTTTDDKIADAAKTNALIKKKLESEWKDLPVNVIQVDDAVNSGIMPVVIERNNRR